MSSEPGFQKALNIILLMLLMTQHEQTQTHLLNAESCVAQLPPSPWLTISYEAETIPHHLAAH